MKLLKCLEKLTNVSLFDAARTSIDLRTAFQATSE